MSSENSVANPSMEGNQEGKNASKKTPGMLFSSMQNTKCAEMYNAAVLKIKSGELEEAIVLLHEAEFFSPYDPAPLVAHAECYVFMCDVKSAIRQYRKALWVSQIRENMDPTSAPVPTIFSAIHKEKLLVLQNSSSLASFLPNIQGSTSPVPYSSEAEVSIPFSHKAGSGDGVQSVPQPLRSGSASSEKSASSSASFRSGTMMDVLQPNEKKGTRENANEERSEAPSSLAERVEASQKVDSQALEAELGSNENMLESNKGGSSGSVEASEAGDASTGVGSSVNSNHQSPQRLGSPNDKSREGFLKGKDPITNDTSAGESPQGALEVSCRTFPPLDSGSNGTDRRIGNSLSDGIQRGGNSYHLSSIRLADIQTRLAGLLDALGVIVFRLKDFPQALQCAEDSLALVEDPVVQLHRCVYLISLQREEEAESLLEEQLKKNEGCRVQTAALLINLLVNRQAFRPARMLIDEFTTLSHCENCIIVAKHIFYSKYERYRQKALEKMDVGTISKCIDVFPNDVELLFTRANISIAAKQYKSSVQDLFRCVKETNGTHKEAIEKMTSVLFCIGTSLDGKEGIRDAIGYYSESLKWQAENKLVLLARADCYVKLEEFENALADYQQLLQIDPDDTTASRRIAFLHDLRGRDLYKQEKVKEAELEFTKAIKQCEIEPLFYYHRALCRFHLGESRYGLRDVLSCQQLNPKDPLIRAFIVRHLGSPDIPQTTKAFKNLVKDATEGKPNAAPTAGGREGTTMASLGRSITSNDLLAAGLCSSPPPRMSETSRRRAKKYYDAPSARVTKALQQARDYAEAEGWRNVAAEKALQARQKKNTSDKKHLSSPVEIVPLEHQQGFLDRKPSLGLGIMRGSHMQIEKRHERRPIPKKSVSLAPSKLPSVTTSEIQKNEMDAGKQLVSPEGSPNPFSSSPHNSLGSPLLSNSALSSEVMRSSAELRRISYTQAESPNDVNSPSFPQPV